MRRESLTKKDLKMGVGFNDMFINKEVFKGKRFHKRHKTQFTDASEKNEKLYRLTNTEKHS